VVFGSDDQQLVHHCLGSNNIAGVHKEDGKGFDCTSASASAASQVGAGAILLQLVVLQPSDQSRANDRAPVGAPEKQ